MKLKIGADPEILITEGGNFRSAHGLIPGTKAEPHPVREGAVQVDGVALEFNVDPCENAAQFTNRIEQLLRQLRGMVPPQYQFSPHVTGVFDPTYFANQPKEAIRLGCDPDFDAYSQKIARAVLSEGDPIRYAGGHLHLGWTENADPLEYSHFAGCCRLACQLDYVLGAPSVLLDADPYRNAYYGRAGNFRPKPYGIEYRTLSNFWIYRKEYIEFVFYQATLAFHSLVDKDHDWRKIHGPYARDTINSHSTKRAIDLLRHAPDLIDPKFRHLFPNLPSKSKPLPKPKKSAALGAEDGPQWAQARPPQEAVRLGNVDFERWAQALDRDNEPQPEQPVEEADEG